MDNVELPLQEVGSWRAVTYFGGSGTLDCAIDSQLLYRHQQKPPLPPAPPPPQPMIPVPDKTVGYNHTILARVDTKNNKKERLHLHLSNDPIRICVGAFIPANQIRGRNKEQRRGVGGGLGLPPIAPPFDLGTPAGEGAGQRRYLARSRNRSCENLLFRVDCGRLTHGGSFFSVALTALMTNADVALDVPSFFFFLFFFKGCPPP